LPVALPGPGDGIPVELCLFVFKILGTFPIVQGVAGGNFFKSVVRAGGDPTEDGLAQNSGVGMMKRKMMDAKGMLAVMKGAFCGMIDTTKDFVRVWILSVHNSISFNK